MKRMSNKLDQRVMTITPELANEWLRRNVKNRPLNKVRVAQLSREIRSGSWQLNGDSIRFSREGSLLDGQHRLAAVVAAGMSIRSVVISGLPDKVFDTIDQGQRRSASQVAQMLGAKNSVIATAGSRLYLAWQMHGTPFAKPTPPNREISNFATSERAQIAATFVVGTRHGRKLCAGTGVFLHLAFSDYSPALAENFLGELWGPAGGHRNPAVCALFDRLVSQEKTSAREELKKTYQIELAFKAFRHFCEGFPTKTLRVNELERAKGGLFRLPDGPGFPP